MKKRNIFIQVIIILLLSALLVQIPLTVWAEPAVPAPMEETESALPQTATTVATAPNPQRHDPTTGVYDGAIYRLRNAAHGTYMDVDNEETDSGTNISTYQYNGKLNQQFRFRYLGQDLYELIPMNSPETYVRTAELGSGSNIEIYGGSSTKTRFRVELQPNGTYVLYSQYNGFANAICFDTTNPNNVVEKNYASLTQKAYGQWYLECVDDSVYDAYTKYYIRNVRTGLYLDVVERGTDCGTIVHARSLIGSENTQWRQIYDEATQAYMIVPVHYNRAKLTLNSTGNLTICSYNSDSTQRFRLEAVGSDACGRTTYRIKTSCSEYTGYLNMGSLMGDVPNFYYLVNGSDANDLWVFEQVLFDSTETTCLYMNTTQQTSVTAYGKKTVLIYPATQLSRYKFEVTKSGNSALTLTVYDNMTCTQPFFYRVLTSDSTKEIVDIALELGHTYYFVLENAAGATSALSVRLRQFTATYHSNDRGDLHATEGIENILGYSNWMNWYVTNKPSMTVSRAKQETNALTGYRDFDSEIFVYSGHGAAGVASYDASGTSSLDPYFEATDLPSMSHCELVVWSSCYSAKKFLGKSMVSQSIAKGAKTAIGWTKTIDDLPSNDYIARLFSAIYSGYTVLQASQFAINCPQFTDTMTIVNSLVLAGDTDNCLFPRPESATIASMEALQTMNSCTFDMSQYTLVAENESCGVKLYTRMLNGIPTDDFYLEFYNMDGEYTGMQKSSYTLDEATVSQFEMEHAAFLQEKTAEERQNLVYTYINGELHLTFRQIAENESGECTAVCTDALSGEVLQ